VEALDLKGRNFKPEHETNPAKNKNGKAKEKKKHKDSDSDIFL